MTWILRDRIGTREAGDWTVSVDLNTNPRLTVRRNGIDHFVTVIQPQDGDEVPSATSLVAADAYVRQKDLVVAYPEKAPLRFGYQTYFSLVDTPDSSLAPNSLVALEAWLSVQTSTWEAYPQLILGLGGNGSRFEAQSTVGVFLSSDKRVALLFHPLDAQDAGLDSDLNNSPAVTVFGRFMEKGVIRRLRLRVLVSDNEIPEEQWKQCRQEFAETPLPLTA